MTEPTRRNIYEEMASICGQLRRLHISLDRPLDELAIEVDDGMFKAIQASIPVSVVTANDHTRRWNEMLIAGVVVRSVEPGTRESEETMMKRGLVKMWVAGRAR